MFSRQGGVRTEGAIWGNGNSRCKDRGRRQHGVSAGLEPRARGRRNQGCAGVKRLRPSWKGPACHMQGWHSPLKWQKDQLSWERWRVNYSTSFPLRKVPLKPHRGGGETGAGETTAAYASPDSPWWGLPEGHPGRCLKTQPPVCTHTHL